VDRILAGNVSGSNQEGSEAGDTKQFWLEAGCRSLTTDPILAGKFASIGEAVGKIQCCRDGASTGATCLRKHSGVCMSGNSTTNMVTFKQAALACETNGYRLCTKQEMQDDSSLGCCKQGCGLDSMLVWTSTFSFKNLKESNEELKTEISNIQTENTRIEQEHKELAFRMGELQNDFNRSAIPSGYKPPPPADTVNQASIPTITGDEAEYLAKENSRLWYEVQAMRRENDELKDHIVAIVNGTIVVGGKGMDGKQGDGGGPGRGPPGRGPLDSSAGDSPADFERPFAGPGLGNRSQGDHGDHGPDHGDRGSDHRKPPSDGWADYGRDGKVWKSESRSNSNTAVRDVPRARNYDQIMMTYSKQHEAEAQNRSNLTSNISSAQEGDLQVGPTLVHNSGAMRLGAWMSVVLVTAATAIAMMAAP